MSNKRTSRLSLLIALLSLSVVLIFTACPPVQGPEPGNGGDKPKVTEEPTAAPTEVPTEEPTAEVTDAPTETPTPEPTEIPTEEPTEEPTAEPTTGYVQSEVSNSTLSIGDEFMLDVRVDIQGTKIAAYGIMLHYDNSIIEINTAKAQTSNGIGTSNGGFVSAAMVQNDSGYAMISAFDVNGFGPGDSIPLFVAYFTTLAAGTTEIELEIDNMSDNGTAPIGIINSQNSTITVE